MKRLALGCLALGIAMTGTAVSAVAADLPPPMYTKAPVMDPGVNWTGFYIGANVGGGWGTGSDSNPFFAVSSTGNFALSGAVAGAQLGYNWQIARWVLGIETDADWSNVTGKTSVGLCGIVVCTETGTWVGTTRGRVGYTFGSWLPYITGGVGYGSVKFSDTGGNVNGTTTRAGGTVGAGVEYAIMRNASVKVEYLYVNLGSAGIPCVLAGGASCGTSSQTFSESIVRGGFNWRF